MVVPTQLLEAKEEELTVMKRDVIFNQYNLSERQGIAIDLALKQGGLTIKDYEKMCSGITKRTLQRELRMLVEMGIFVTEGTTYNRIYKFAKQEKPGK